MSSTQSPIKTKKIPEKMKPTTGCPVSLDTRPLSNTTNEPVPTIIQPMISLINDPQFCLLLIRLIFYILCLSIVFCFHGNYSSSFMKHKKYSWISITRNSLKEANGFDYC